MIGRFSRLGVNWQDFRPASETSHGCSTFVVAHATGRRSNHVFHDTSDALDYALVSVAPPKLQAGSWPSTLGWDVSETSQRPGTQRSAACRQPRAEGWQICPEATERLNDIMPPLCLPECSDAEWRHLSHVQWISGGANQTVMRALPLSGVFFLTISDSFHSHWCVSVRFDRFVLCERSRSTITSCRIEANGAKRAKLDL